MRHGIFAKAEFSLDLIALRKTVSNVRMLELLIKFESHVKLLGVNGKYNVSFSHDVDCLQLFVQAGADLSGKDQSCQGFTLLEKLFR